MYSINSLQYNLGSGTKLWYTPKLYNDGKWHTIEATRDGAKGRFTVDNEDIVDVSQPIAGTTIDAYETFFFGGYPQQHSIQDVTNYDFDGCIDNVTITSPVDLSQNVRAYGVTPGCPAKVKIV